MQITSAAFDNEGEIPTKYTCEGEDVSPPLEFHAVPQDARSLALVVDDPDAATDPKGPGKVFDHWLLFNLPPDTTALSPGSIPEAASEGVNGSGQVGYMGPCPPTGEHRYFFKLYALPNPLNLPPGISKDELLEAIEGQTLAKAQLLGRYSKRSA